MQFDPTDMVSAINRIKRAQGQLGGVLRMLGEGRDCEDILTPSLPPSSVHSIAPGPPSCQPGSSNGQWRRHRPASTSRRWRSSLPVLGPIGPASRG